MQTKSVMMQTLCVPCACRCRYCLLSWDGRTIGADYDRSQRLAERIYDELRQERPDLAFHFSFGYSMDHPRLLEAIDFLNRIGSISGKILQCDGLAFRSCEEMEALLKGIQEHGVETLNFTFYGTEAYHDRFAGRKGDHAYLLSLMEHGAGIGLRVSAGVPLTKENIDQVDRLLSDIEAHGSKEVRLFVPHGEGRGANLEGIRLALDDLSLVGENARNKLNRKVYQTEAEWCKIQGGDPEKDRMLLISLTKENLDQLESMSAAQILSSVEALDDAYYGAFPTFRELLTLYGDREGRKLYSRRDLFHRLRRQNAKEHGIHVYDVTDERQTGSRRY